MTVSLFFRITINLTAYMNIICKYTSSLHHFSVHGVTGYFLWYLFGTENWGIGSFDDLFLDKKWHHVCGTYDSIIPTNNLNFYIDGVHRATKTTSGLITVNTQAITCCKSFGDYSPMNISNISLYNIALPPREINSIYNILK